MAQDDFTHHPFSDSELVRIFGQSKGIMSEEELYYIKCFLLISHENMFRKDILLFSEAEVA